jgi:hypothetical protein
METLVTTVLSFIHEAWGVFVLVIRANKRPTQVPVPRALGRAWLCSIAVFGLTGCGLVSTKLVQRDINSLTKSKSENSAGHSSANRNTTSFELVTPIFQEFCISCHSSSSTIGSLESYSARRRVSDIDWWKLTVEKVTSGAMPPSKPTSPEAQDRLAKGIKLLTDWQAEGFPEFAAKGADSIDQNNSLFTSEISTVEACTGDDPLPARLWILTKDQIQNALRDTFGDNIELSDFSHPSVRANGLSVPVNTRYDEVSMSSFVSFSERFFAQISANNVALSRCISASGTSCVREFITTYGRKLWRRTLLASEVQQAVDKFAAAEPMIGRRLALQMNLGRLLVSPHFVYRSELTQVNSGSGVSSLTPFETASLLSFTIWNSIPDEALLVAAERNELNSIERIDTQITRMIADPRGRRSIKAFFGDWLQLDSVLTQPKSATLFPTVNAPVRQALRNEMNLYIDELVWNERASLSQFFTSSRGFASNLTANLYGVNVNSSAAVPVTLDPTQRSGILTQPGFLLGHSGANGTGYVHRGVFFLDNVSCQPIPPAPPSAIAMANMMEPNVAQMSTRQIQALHSRNPSCASCHNKIDPIGAAFEKYDALGAFRSVENGIPIDASGVTEGLGDVSPRFSDAVSLVGNLAHSQHFQQCFTKRVYQYGFGDIPRNAQGCELARVHSYLKGRSFTLREVYSAIFKAKYITTRNKGE